MGFFDFLFKKKESKSTQNSCSSSTERAVLNVKTTEPSPTSDKIVRKKNESRSAQSSCPHSAPYVILDVETTGLYPSTDRIIQLSAIKYDTTGQPMGSYNTYLNPGIPIPAEASRINGIKDWMVSSAPSAAEVQDAFFSFLGDCLIVGYNVTFDLKFIESEFDVPVRERPYVDAMSIARRSFDLPNYKLQTVASHAGFYSSQFHNSLVDCEAVAAVLRRACPDLNNYIRQKREESPRSYEDNRNYWQGKEYYQNGETERLAGNFDSAFSLFEKAHEKGYRRACVYEAMAKIYRKLDDYEKEIAVLDRGICACDPFSGKEDLLERKRKAEEYLARSQQKEAEELQKMLDREERERQRQQEREERLKQKELEKLEKAKQPRRPTSRPIMQLSDDGTVIKEFPSVAEASRVLGINDKCIRDAARGRQKHAGGYCWKYVSPVEEVECV